MAIYRHTNTYAPKGLNLAAPETARNADHARDGKNFTISAGADLIKRPGFGAKADDACGFGLTAWGKRSLTNASGDGGWGIAPWGTAKWGSPDDNSYGVVTETLVGLADVPKVWTEGSFAIAYSGGGTGAVTVRTSASNTVELLLIEDGATVLTHDLGTGYEGSPETMTSLKTAVDAVANFAATITGTATTPAAFLDYRNAQTISTSETIYFGYWTDTVTPLSSQMPETVARSTEDTYELASTASLNGVLYIGNGYDNMHKYDGQTCFRAGLPTPSDASISTAVDTGTPGVAGMSGSYRYKVSYRQLDEVLNVHEGDLSSATTAVDNSAGPYAIDVTVPNLSAGLGYNTRGALFTATGNSTNIGIDQERLSVDDGAGGEHDIQVGDRVYFYDTVSAAYVSYKVVARSASTIDIDSSQTVGVTDNAAVSVNFRIVIYRTKAGGTLYYQVAELPYDVSAGTQTYSDVVPDANLTVLAPDLNRVPGEPPKAKYLTVWRNQLIAAGDPSDPDVVYYSEFSDSTSPENFPAINQLQIAQNRDDPITGLGVMARNLFIFTETQIFVVEGNLASHQVRVDLLSDSVGCVAHHSIQVLDNQMFFLSNKGVHRITPGGAGFRIEDISAPLNTIFRHGANNDYRNSYLRVQAAVWPEERQYLLYLPSESLQDTTRYGDSDSIVIVYDIDMDHWYKWDNINAWGGFTMFDDGRNKNVPWWTSAELDGSTVVRRTNRMHSTNTEIDYSDHTAGVDFEYFAQWDFGYSPRVAKSYNIMTIDSYAASAELAYTPSGDITIGVYRDFNPSTAELSFTVSPASDDQQLVEALPDSQRRALGLKFSNSTVNKQVLISGWSTQSYSYRQETRR